MLRLQGSKTQWVHTDIFVACAFATKSCLQVAAAVQSTQEGKQEI